MLIVMVHLSMTIVSMPLHIFDKKKMRLPPVQVQRIYIESPLKSEVHMLNSHKAKHSVHAKGKHTTWRAGPGASLFANRKHRLGRNLTRFKVGSVHFEVH